MPISQERLITLIAHADTALSAFDSARKYIKGIQLAETISELNSAKVHTSDQTTKDILTKAVGDITTILTYVNEIEIPQELRDAIAKERLHFQQNRKKNDLMARYNRVRRSIQHNAELSHAQVPTFDWLYGANAQAPNAQGPTQSAEPPGAQAPTQAPYGQGPTEKPLTIEERIARRKANGQSDEKLAKPRSDSVFPPGETDTLTPAQSAALTPNKAQGHYDPDIISTSVPSIEDMTEDETPADRPVL